MAEQTTDVLTGDKDVSSTAGAFTSPPPVSKDDVAAIDALRGLYDKLRAEVGKRIIGQEDVVEQLLICILARGHALLMGVPGLAKTLMVNSLADVMSLQFSRIQFTPDLMPSDITGTDILQDSADTPGKREFKFIKGPVFANIVLADEINRTPPKTQSALLEAMQEHKVTTAGPDAGAARAVLCAGDTESDRAGGDVSAARGAVGPLHVFCACRVSDRG